MFANDRTHAARAIKGQEGTCTFTFRSLSESDPTPVAVAHAVALTIDDVPQHLRLALDCVHEGLVLDEENWDRNYDNSVEKGID